MLSGADLDAVLGDVDDVGLDPVPPDDDDEPVAAASVSPSANAASGVGGAVAADDKPVLLFDGAVQFVYLVRSGDRSTRLGDGSVIGYRTVEGEPLREDTVGSGTLPWALDIVARRLGLGDVVEVTGRGEFILRDDEDLAPGDEAVTRWRFELVTASGEVRDKFRLSVDERIACAHECRERGNAVLKRGRLLRAGGLYEQGSQFMDVIEAEDMGMPGKKDERAVAQNRRLRECQQPLLLNWSLTLMRRGRFKDAADKCTEVLLDVDRDCVKALLRRGSCQVELGSLDEARADLTRAKELDPTVATDVAREMAKLNKKQKAQDQKDRGFMKKMLEKGLSDDRSVPLHVAAPASGHAPAGSATRPPVALEDDENEGLDIRVASSSPTRVNSAPAAEPLTGEPHPMMAALKAQDKAASKNGMDDSDADWCRQREAIYNQFLKPGVQYD